MGALERVNYYLKIYLKTINSNPLSATHTQMPGGGTASAS